MRREEVDGAFEKFWEANDSNRMFASSKRSRE